MHTSLSLNKNNKILGLQSSKQIWEIKYPCRKFGDKERKTEDYGEAILNLLSRTAYVSVNVSAHSRVKQITA